MTTTSTLASYRDFIASKTQLAGDYGFDPIDVPSFLFPFQADLLTWALRKGRGGLFADCGLGKGAMALAWANNVHLHTGKRVLVTAPLAASFQLEAEAQKFGFDVGISRDGKPAENPVTITNYDRLEHFDPSAYGGTVCDESSAIKAYDSKRRALVTEFMREMPYRLLGTATAAPNDVVELGTSSQALGHLGHQDMLDLFFTNKDRSSAARKSRFTDDRGWRLRGHAETDFWRWVSSWARACRRPSDLGYPDDGFVLPPLEERLHIVGGDLPPDDGGMIALPAKTLDQQRAERAGTLKARCVRASELLADADSAIAWCNFNNESALLTELIDGAVELRGSDHPDAKEEILLEFTRGKIRVLVTKPSISGFGMNWQHCCRMTYFPTHSYLDYYQAIRRCWRYGQDRPVLVDVITTPGGERVLTNLRRKAAQADAMFTALVAHMNNPLGVVRSTYQEEVRVPAWLQPR